MLTQSYQNVAGVDTFADRMFSCQGDVGNPPGHIEIYSNIAGEFGPFLTAAKVEDKSIYGFIHTVEPVSITQCSNTQTVFFALTNVTMKMHRKLLQCVTVPHSNLSTTENSTSDIQEIEVVRGKCKCRIATFIRTVIVKLVLLTTVLLYRALSTCQ